MRYLIPLLVIASACNRLNPDDYDKAIDQDSDGFASVTYGGLDCDDLNPDINPDATEQCDGADNDCDGETDEGDAPDASIWYIDDDGDGYGDPSSESPACTQPSGWVADDSDCDDNDAAIHPDTLWYADDDTDGFGWADTSVQQCEQPSGYVLDSDDCDDTRDDVNPDEEEQCDKVDHDCDGNSGLLDEDGDGWAVCEGDCDDDLGDDPKGGPTADTIHPDADEYCDGVDNNCDEAIDESTAIDAITWYADTDTDSYGDAAVTTVECHQPSGYILDATDCDDSDAEVYPGAVETCNGIDDDCDDVIDEPDASDALTWYADSDGDGYGDLATSTLACDATTGWVSDATDCDDTDPDQYPGADEYCNGEDDDCDASVDEDDAQDAPIWHVDADGDTYGTNTSVITACNQPSGYVLDDSDCDDTDSAINPGADEICNGVDDDCDEFIDGDESVDAGTWYADDDGDGYGNDDTAYTECNQPTDTVAIGGDCDDTDSAINPDATEVCDGVDNDCDPSNDYDVIVDPSGVASAYTTISDGITNTPAPGGTLCLMDGTYSETVVLDVEIVVHGQSRDGTVIEGIGAGPALTLYNLNTTSSAEVSSLTLTGGVGAYGAGLNSIDSDAVLIDLLVEGNTATGGSGDTCTGTIVKVDGSYRTVLVDGLEVRDNVSTCGTVRGQIAVGNDADMVIDHLDMRNNAVIADVEADGGFYCQTCSLDITNGIIAGNTVSPSAAAGSISIRSGVFDFVVASVSITNVTIYGNVMDAGTSGSIQSGVLYSTDYDHKTGAYGVDLVNTSISSNITTAPSVTDSIATTNASWSYCHFHDYEGGGFGYGADPSTDLINPSGDPLFVDVTDADPANWDLSLQEPASPLYDAGTRSFNDADGTRSDIGAYGGPGGDSW